MEKYRKLIDKQWRVVKVRAVGSIHVEEEWESFKGAILITSDEVCGLRTVGAGGKKSEYWNEEAAVAVSEKREAFAMWLQKKIDVVGKWLQKKIDVQEETKRNK
jgi:hypothetical protein